MVIFIIGVPILRFARIGPGGGSSVTQAPTFCIQGQTGLFPAILWLAGFSRRDVTSDALRSSCMMTPFRLDERRKIR